MTLIDFKVERELHQILKDVDAESEYTSSFISDMSEEHKKEYLRRLKAMKLDIEVAAVAQHTMKELVEVNTHPNP